jgi:predicted amidohydrolase
MLEEKIWQISQPTDLIVLPEMFTTGFTMLAEAQAEVARTTTLKWMQQLAKQTQAVITGSYIVQEGGQYFNRLLWVEPSGSYQQYDKRHLFRMANEHEHYSAGTERIICEWRGWKICPLICYDLRFPVWSRNLAYNSTSNELAYDLLLYVANWPAARQQAWDVLLPARAVENLCYTAGLNRVGEDGNGIAYTGGSGVFGFKGDTLWQQHQTEVIKTLTLSGKELVQYRLKFPAQLDADRFTLL